MFRPHLSRLVQIIIGFSVLLDLNCLMAAPTTSAPGWPSFSSSRDPFSGTRPSTLKEYDSLFCFWKLEYLHSLLTEGDWETKKEKIVLFPDSFGHYSLDSVQSFLDHYAANHPMIPTIFQYLENQFLQSKKQLMAAGLRSNDASKDFSNKILDAVEMNIPSARWKPYLDYLRNYDPDEATYTYQDKMRDINTMMAHKFSDELEVKVEHNFHAKQRLGKNKVADLIQQKIAAKLKQKIKSVLENDPDTLGTKYIFFDSNKKKSIADILDPYKNFYFEQIPSRIKKMVIILMQHNTWRAISDIYDEDSLRNDFLIWRMNPLDLDHPFKQNFLHPSGLFNILKSQIKQENIHLTIDNNDSFYEIRHLKTTIDDITVYFYLTANQKKQVDVHVVQIDQPNKAGKIKSIASGEINPRPIRMSKEVGAATLERMKGLSTNIAEDWNYLAFKYHCFEIFAANRDLRLGHRLNAHLGKYSKFTLEKNNLTLQSERLSKTQRVIVAFVEDLIVFATEPLEHKRKRYVYRSAHDLRSYDDIFPGPSTYQNMNEHKKRQVQGRQRAIIKGILNLKAEIKRFYCAQQFISSKN